jgi:hypothetical protein
VKIAEGIEKLHAVWNRIFNLIHVGGVRRADRGDQGPPDDFSVRNHTSCPFLVAVCLLDKRGILQCSDHAFEIWCVQPIEQKTAGRVVRKARLFEPRPVGAILRGKTVAEQDRARLGADAL